jgi:hypothetical protein
MPLIPETRGLFLVCELGEDVDSQLRLLAGTGLGSDQEKSLPHWPNCLWHHVRILGFRCHRELLVLFHKHFQGNRYRLPGSVRSWGLLTCLDWRRFLICSLSMSPKMLSQVGVLSGFYVVVGFVVYCCTFTVDLAWVGNMPHVHKINASFNSITDLLDISPAPLSLQVRLCSQHC